MNSYHTGVYKDNIFLPEYVHKKPVVPDTVEVPPNLSPSTDTAESCADLVNINKQTIKGYAVINIMSKAKVETVIKSLSKCKVLVESGASSQQDVPEEMLHVDTVNPMLIAEENGNEGLEHYLRDKFFNGDDESELSDPATLALIEIFHSCFIMEQRHGLSEYKQESGYICLGKDQILQNQPENLLCVFMNNIKMVKKSLTEQVMQVLRKYGITKSPDKEL